jgi:hypothetical protein
LTSPRGRLSLSSLVVNETSNTSPHVTQAVAERFAAAPTRDVFRKRFSFSEDMVLHPGGKLPEMFVRCVAAYLAVRVVIRLRIFVILPAARSSRHMVDPRL